MSTWLTQQQLYARVASIVACALVASACDLGKHTHSHTTEREVGSVLPDAARGYGGSRARIGIVSERPRNFGKVALAKRWAGTGTGHGRGHPVNVDCGFGGGGRSWGPNIFIAFL